MKHLSLFSGIGGLDLAAEWAGFETVAFVERDPYCQRVLAKRWPGVPVIPDVRWVAADASSERRQQVAGGAHGDEGEDEGRRAAHDYLAQCAREGGIQLVSGGFPCQPHSVAGKREASADDRDLWPEVARVLREIRPRWFVGENVRGLLYSESGRFFGRVLGDLADLGYSVGWGVWGAADVGALHQRERVFIVAHANGQGQLQPCGLEREERGWPSDRGETVLRDPAGSRLQERAGEALGRSAALAEPERSGGALADADEQGSQGRFRGSVQERAAERVARASGASIPDAHGEPQGWSPEPWSERGYWQLEPDVGRVAHGVPARVDRLRALGNAVVPQQAYPLFAAIAEHERMTLERTFLGRAE